MKYSKELHDKLRNRTGLHILNHQVGVDSEDIDALLDEIERLEMAISRLKEDGERLAINHTEIDGYGEVICQYCGNLIISNHEPDCAILTHRALMKELE